jgi:uncharacterized membrane protein YozB (DUF420 family)
MTRSDIGEHLALLNALLNAASAVLIVLGRIAVGRGRRDVHRRFMTAAFLTSSLFLVSYLTRVALTGTHVDPHHGVVHYVYLAVLLSHMVLAITVVPLVLRTIYLARGGRFVQHRAIARFTYPIWLYVSVTGVVVYLMLYHLPV